MRSCRLGTSSTKPLRMNPCCTMPFKRTLEEEQVPERVPVERAQVKRAAVRNQKIRTDTGIEVTFPAEMARNSEYIEFCERA